LKFGSLLGLLNPQSWTDLVMKAINSAKDEVLGSVIPAWDEMDIARSVLSLTEKLDAILEKTQAHGYQTYLAASKIAASEKSASDNQIAAWASAAVGVDAGFIRQQSAGSKSATPSTGSAPTQPEAAIVQTAAPTPSVSASCNFTRDLYQGVSGSDVLCLQRYLNVSGFVIAASGPGSPGNETSYFGPLMVKAVSNWQIANNISPASGYVGTLMRAKLNISVSAQGNAITAESAPTPSSPTPISSPPPASATSPYNVLPPSGSSGGSGGSVGSSGGGGGGTISRPNTSVILNPLVFVSPSSGVAGTTFSEPGRGFTPNSTATLHFRKPDGIEYPILNIQTDGSGNYENSWTSSRTSQTGAYIYWTIDTTGLISSTATFRIIAAQQMSQTQTNTPVPSPVAPPSPAAPGMSALQPPISAPIVNPMLYLLPTSGAKGTKFTFAGIKFTPNGVIREIITKPNGTQYAPNYYTANTDGNHDKAYDSSTASIFGTYTIYWVDESTGSRSNTVYETISAY